MPTDLTVIEAAQNLPAALGPDLTTAVDLAKAEKARSTRKAYGLPAVQGVVRGQGCFRFAGKP
jgi:hypothetical protein